MSEYSFTKDSKTHQHPNSLDTVLLVVVLNLWVATPLGGSSDLFTGVVHPVYQIFTLKFIAVAATKLGSFSFSHSGPAVLLFRAPCVLPGHAMYVLQGP